MKRRKGIGQLQGSPLELYQLLPVKSFKNLFQTLLGISKSNSEKIFHFGSQFGVYIWYTVFWRPSSIQRCLFWPMDCTDFFVMLCLRLLNNPYTMENFCDFSMLLWIKWVKNGSWVRSYDKMVDTDTRYLFYLRISKVLKDFWQVRFWAADAFQLSMNR